MEELSARAIERAHHGVEKKNLEAVHQVRGIVPPAVRPRPLSPRIQVRSCSDFLLFLSSIAPQHLIIAIPRHQTFRVPSNSQHRLPRPAPIRTLAYIPPSGLATSLIAQLYPFLPPPAHPSFAMSSKSREYDLSVRQQPKQARMCGVGADRRPIDPPPIVQLRVIDHNRRTHPRITAGCFDAAPAAFGQTFLQNPYYFMFASLAKPDDDTELHWMKDGKTRCTTGSVVSSLYHLKDSENDNRDAGFFVFPDLSVRQEGSYRLKLSLFEVVGLGFSEGLHAQASHTFVFAMTWSLTVFSNRSNVYHCKSIFSAPFYVYTAKKFPGMEESTPLSCSLADQGIKIRIRKDIRQRKPRGSGPPFPAMALPHPLPAPVPIPDDEEPEPESEPEEKSRKRSSVGEDREEREREREVKRARLEGDSSGEWSIDPALAPPPAPPTSNVSAGTGSSSYEHHRPTLQSIPPPPPPPPATGEPSLYAASLVRAP
ncbi:hypothetical protein EW146_g1964, partial [Bondarzewia mesenterica]